MLVPRKLWALLFLSGCAATDALDNGEFYRWCGNSPCSWTTDVGEVSRVSTWHAHDYGVSFDTTPSQISQLARAGYRRCTSVTMVADVDPAAGLTLVIDDGDDGEPELSQLIVGEHYTRVEFVLRSAPRSDTVRYLIRKTGTGKARLASLVVLDDDRCASQTVPRSDGEPCTSASDCSAGACVAGLCSACGHTPCATGVACTISSQCASGSCTGGLCDPCGLRGDCAADVPCDLGSECASRSCVRNALPSTAPAAGTGGSCAACVADADCGAAFCVAGQCAACRDDADCESGAVCRYPDPWDARERACLPPLGEGQPRGGLCEREADCNDGLACAAAPGLAPRCGTACISNADCGADEACIAPASCLGESCLFGWLFGPSDGSPDERVYTCMSGQDIAQRAREGG